MEKSEKSIPYKKRKNNYQSNIVTKSKHQFSLQEQKIVAFVINQIDHTENTNGHNITFDIPLTEIAPYISYEQIKKTTKSILSKQIWTENGEDFQGIVPFPFVKYDAKKGVLSIMMISHIVPYFIELGKEYTKYPLDVFLSFDSVYSQRFYQILMMFLGRKQNKFIFSIDKLQSNLNCDYPNFKDLRRRVLDVAQKEIEEKANIIFTYTPTKKTGKKIIELEFCVKSSVDLALDSVENEAKTFFQHSPSERNTYIKNLLVAYKFPVKLQQQITENPEALAHFMQLESEIANGIRKNINNVAAYIAKSMREFLKLSKI
jgi:plasmid replication initiation protein